MRKSARKIASSLDELLQACETIYESKQSCEGCPMSHLCIRDMTLASLADTSPTTFDEMLTAADELSCYAPSREEWEAEEANLRRCDPDYM